MKANKNILLISYVFPPYYGIGGRRWAKHAVGLTKLGYTVHVICAHNIFKKKSLWYDEVKNNPNIIIYQLPTRYPKSLVNFEHNLFQKVEYKFWIKVLPFLVKGSYLDRSIFWKRPMLNKASKIIRQYKINNVICTGGPFGVMYFSTLLKKKFNDILLINDLRDPWTWGPNWGFPNLSGKRMAFEKSMEKLTMLNSDIISVPSDDMLEYLSAKYPECSHKLRRIPHFYDPDEIKTLRPRTASKDKIRFIMYGNIYHNIEPFIKKTIEIFSKYKDKISLDIYTDKLQYQRVFANAGADNVKFYSQIPAIELFDKFSDYDFVFLLNPKYNRNNISTKFYEIIYTKTPIFMFCDDGIGPRFIVDNHLGLHCDLANVDRTFEELVNNKISFTYNSNYNISEYSIGNVVKKIESYFIPVQQTEDDVEIKKLLITFDYELFLGSKSGTAVNCIIEPTNSILEVLRKFHVKKSIFFVDTAYLLRLESICGQNEMAREDYHLIFNQLVEILHEGHYIFPHIHPHWLEAVYDKNLQQWTLENANKYRLHNTTREEREYLFGSSVKLIAKIQDTAGVYYPVDAYRAGGWCIQPFDDFKPFFEKYGIKYDFSVLSDFKMLNQTFFYDFSSPPPRKIYRFESDIKLQDKNGRFTEFSITNIQIPKINHLKNRVFIKILNRLNHTNFGDGMAVVKNSDILTEPSNTENTEMTSIELLTRPKLKLYKDFAKNNSFIQLVSHPKMLSRHNVNCFDKYLKFLLENFVVETDYKKIAEHAGAKQ